MSTIEDDLLDKKKEISSEKDQIDAENISLI